MPPRNQRAVAVPPQSRASLAYVVHGSMPVQRRRSVGAEVVERGVHFRVWAPSVDEVAVVIDGRDFSLQPETDGYFAALVGGARAGTLYKFRLRGETYPDPASRFQPEGVHGPSQVIDPAFSFRDWPGVPDQRVLYEMHIGTFTPEGTYAAAMKHFGALAGIGINVLELMPVNEFPGTFGWGYDGVDLWAPTRLYGTPDDLRRFVDQAHAHGLAVILDVVYNHLGPDGCYLSKFTKDYFTDEYENEWGEAVNFDGPNAHGVRTFVTENAAHWIDEYRFDGLRVDATQSMFDESRPHVLAEITEAVRKAASGRKTFVVAENEPQDTRLLREYGFDAMWNDDWHHSAMVAATGKREAYYTDYYGTPQELVSMARLGFLYQGQWYSWQKKNRGTPSVDIAPERLVVYLQNHDQVANSQRGERTHHPALLALLLLQPQTPLLFQGQEFAASTPFTYFADHEPELAEKVAKGRRDFLGQFPSINGAILPAPNDRANFERCKLDHSEWETHAEVVAMVRELLRLRRSMPFEARMEGAVLSHSCLALRWFGDDPRLLIVNLAGDVGRYPVNDPIVAGDWDVLWAAESAVLFGPKKA